MTRKRLRSAVVLLLGLALLGAPASLRALERPFLPSTVWDLLVRLLPDAGAKNRAGIDPDGVQAAPETENRAGIDPNGAQAVPETENRASIDPNG